MTCEGCSEPKPGAEELGQVFIAYTGGGPFAQLSALRYVLPPGTPLPTLHKDGSIEYENRAGGWEPPRPIDGYLRDSMNHNLFRPLWELCPDRLFGAKYYENCGCIDVVAVCNRPGYECYREQVMYANCCQCLFKAPLARPPATWTT